MIHLSVKEMERIYNDNENSGDNIIAKTFLERFEEISSLDDELLLVLTAVKDRMGRWAGFLTHKKYNRTGGKVTEERIAIHCSDYTLEEVVGHLVVQQAHNFEAAIIVKMDISFNSMTNIDNKI